ncbi:hypothetical protein [Achromobacter sp. DH1f]|uniref:hypothetical protein n=1 Tax=Achromobacter sp. DH1f TaxID=1397275 RepID=UPI0004695A47|nr:hypothetical protein [Achromobacter sp. DH1f]
MVLPLVPVVLGAGAIASAITGLKKAWDAKQNFSSARNRVQNAEREWRLAAQALDNRREEVCLELASLGELRLQITTKSLSKFGRLVAQVAKSDIASIEVEGYHLPIEIVPMDKIEGAVYEATEFLRHGLQSAASGAMVGAGVGQAVTLLGTASTGTAISGLSGAAATNATLAWLGGGSLASGGLGMAGGTAVLGGVVAGPVLLVMGYLAAGKSEEALTQAHAHAVSIDESVEQISNAGLALDALDQRAREVAWVLEALNERFQASANRVSRMLGRVRRAREDRYLNVGKEVPASLASRKIEYAKLSEDDQNSFNMLIVLGTALHRMAKIEILNKKGGLTRASASMVREMQSLVEAV